jgi:hypothetical protein
LLIAGALAYENFGRANFSACGDQPRERMESLERQQHGPLTMNERWSLRPETRPLDRHLPNDSIGKLDTNCVRTPTADDEDLLSMPRVDRQR